MHTHIRNIVIFFIAALLGFLSFIAITNHYAYTSTLFQLKKTQSALVRAPALTYGKVVSVDAANQSITVLLNNKKTIRYEVAKDAYIARQALIGNGEVYTGLSEPIPSLLSDIEAEMNVSMFVYRSDTGYIVAGVILFGNPL